jgi:hypothetical protein
MADLETKLSNPLKQVYQVAALGLAIGMQFEEAAAHAHITQDRLRSYLRDPRFQEFLQGFNTDIEGKVIERAARRRTRALGRLQLASESAALTVINLMANADKDSVKFTAAKGILKQVGIDLDHIGYNDELENPEELIKRKDPNFLDLQEETMKELASG